MGKQTSWSAFGQLKVPGPPIICSTSLLITSSSPSIVKEKYSHNAWWPTCSVAILISYIIIYHLIQCIFKNIQSIGGQNKPNAKPKHLMVIKSFQNVKLYV